MTHRPHGRFLWRKNCICPFILETCRIYNINHTYTYVATEKIFQMLHFIHPSVIATLHVAPVAIFLSGKV